MDIKVKKTIRIEWLVFWLLMVFIICPMPYAMEKGHFQPPNLEGYTLDRTRYLDKDVILDGVKETRLEVFKNSSGQLILKYTTNGKIWAWGVVNTPNDTNDFVNNYVLRDGKGNGEFDERYTAKEHFYLPDWVKGKAEK